MRRAFALAFLLAACGGKASESECEKLADHLLDLWSKDGADPAAWKKAAGPVRATLVERCREQMSSGRVECMLEAPDEAAAARCD